MDATRTRTRVGQLLAAASLSLAAAAQTPIGGTLYDGNGGPLRTGVVYHTTTHVTVPAGQTLTAEAGAIVKLNGHEFAVLGTFIAQGTATAPVILTSIHDDAAGGDTNGNGAATVPAPNQWYGVRLTDTADASQLRHVIVRYTGWGYHSTIDLLSANASITDCTFSDGGYGGMHLDAGARPQVARCTFERIDNHPAVFGAAFDAVPGFVDGTVSACGGGNYLRVDTTTVAGNVTVQPRNCLGAALVFTNHLAVPLGTSLTLDAGVVLKPISGQAIEVAGEFHANGSAAEPVVLTSYLDDTAGGDTNGDGNATSPAPNQWYGLRFQSTADASTLRYTSVRYSGWGYWPAVTVESADVTIEDCSIRDGGNGGMRLDSLARPSVARCSFERIASNPAIYGCAIDAVPGFVDNSVSSCPGGGYLRMDATTLVGDVTLGPRNQPGGALTFANHLAIPQGTSLTLAAGVVLKPMSTFAIQVAGTLRTAGTAAAPVVLTSIHDDTVGGDTNGNGNATAGGPNQWYGVKFDPTAGGSTLEHTIVRYAGWGYWPTVSSDSASITMSDCVLSDSGNGGLRLDANGRPRVTHCSFERIANAPAVFGASWPAVAGFWDNTVAGCPGGGYLRVDDTGLTGNAWIGARSCLGGALVINGNAIVAAGARLTLIGGVVLKPLSTHAITVHGRLDVEGPVVITSYADDVFGGDTNGDGNATTGAPSQWYGLRLESDASGTLDRLLIRCAGWGYWPGLYGASPAVVLRGCRTEFCGNGGIVLQDALVAQDLVAFGVLGDGITVNGGVFDLRRCTSAYVTGYGIRRGGGFTGAARSCISWFNNGAGFQGFARDTVHYSDGSGITGGSGNFDRDPLFADAGSGNLTLLPGSPSIDAGAPTDLPSGLDPLGNPRLLDGDLDGAMRVDQGAHEYGHCALLVSGDPSPGSTLTIRTASTPSIGAGLLAIGLPTVTPLQLFQLGFLQLDFVGPFLSLPWPTTGAVPVTVPPEIGTPLLLGFQYVGISDPTPHGNVSNPVFVEID
ncbi:MAG: hypothetical protein IPM29_24620 [Planctomycetes bacterium]|nr:hypothetical protein [Planctomycetota bacterium]